MEIKTEIKKLVVEYECDYCEHGTVISTGYVLEVFPPLYPAKCDSCNHAYTLNDVYPRFFLDFSNN